MTDRRPVLVAIPPVQAVDAAQAHDVLHLGQLDARRRVVRVGVALRQAEERAAGLVQVVLGQQVPRPLQPRGVVDDFIRPE